MEANEWVVAAAAAGWALQLAVVWLRLSYGLRIEQIRAGTTIDIINKLPSGSKLAHRQVDGSSMTISTAGRRAPRS